MVYSPEESQDGTVTVGLIFCKEEGQDAPPSCIVVIEVFVKVVVFV